MINSWWGFITLIVSYDSSSVNNVLTCLWCSRCHNGLGRSGLSWICECLVVFIGGICVFVHLCAYYILLGCLSLFYHVSRYACSCVLSKSSGLPKIRLILLVLCQLKWIHDWWSIRKYNLTCVRKILLYKNIFEITVLYRNPWNLSRNSSSR